MPRARGVVAVLVAAFSAAALFAQETELPPNPHEPLNQEDACPSCHLYWTNKEGQKELVPGEFVASVPEMCWMCHPQEKLGRSHPVGVDPRESDPIVEVPEGIPLENGLVSCGSCHVPHGEYLARTRCFEKQQPLVVIGEGETAIKYFKTFYLRIPGDPAEGFNPLCQACHPDF
jgi:hypothetical protein